MAVNINDFKVPNVPDTVFYIPNFISEDEETEILERVNSVPKPKWTCLSNRRLQNWGGIPHPNGMIAEAIPEWLSFYIDKINILGILIGDVKLNHVLVNEYKSGQGIMPHLDGPLFYPTVTTISCGSHTVLDFYKPMDHSSTANIESAFENNELADFSEKNKECSLLIERRSLLILQDSMYKNYLHGISETTIDGLTEKVANLKNTIGCFNVGDELERGTRISLTVRNVPKTSKFKLKF